MKVFLDVGAHTGETVRAVIGPGYAFDRIECFEPVPECCDVLERLGKPKVGVHRFGLWDRTGQHQIYDPGHLGASVHSDARPGATQAVVSFVQASEWFRANLSDSDEVYLKLNCEGAECDIIDDLLASGEIHKVKAMLVHFDVRKAPSQAHREAETRLRLREYAAVDVAVADEVFRGSQSYLAGVQRWLDDAGARAGRRGLRELSASVRFEFVPRVIRMVRLPALARRLLPRRVYRRMVSRFSGYEI